MANKKQLVILIENTVAMRRSYVIILYDYLEKLIRLFAGIKPGEASSPEYEISIVKFNSPGAYTPDPCLVEPCGWSIAGDYFTCLSGITFSDCDFPYAAIAEGLAEVLMMQWRIQSRSSGMFALDGDQIQQNDVFQRHCILVAASNPYPLRTSVYLPPDNMSETISSDAETIAKSFPQNFVSLSVICPKQLPKLRAIYNAGKRNPSAADHTIHIATNPNHLVLLSQDFLDACPDLSHSGITILPSDLASASEPPPESDISELVPNPIPSWSDLYSMINWTNSSPLDFAPTSTAGLNPSSASIMVSTQPLQNIPPVSTTQEDADAYLSYLAVSSPPFQKNDDDLQQPKPPASRPMNSSILNSIATSYLDVSSPPFQKNDDDLQQPKPPASRPMNSGVLNSIATSYLDVSSPPFQLQQPRPPASGPMNSGILNSIATSSLAKMKNVVPTETMRPPASRMSQQAQAEFKVPSSQPKFVKLWEGGLSCKRQDELILITKLKCYREETALASLSQDWPSTMLVDRVLHPDDLNKMQYTGKKDFIAVVTTNEHMFIQNLRRMNGCAVVKLPSHVLLLFTSDKEYRLFGWLLPGWTIEPDPPRQQLTSEQQKQVPSSGPNG